MVNLAILTALSDTSPLDEADMECLSDIQNERELICLALATKWDLGSWTRDGTCALLFCARPLNANYSIHLRPMESRD